MKIYKTGALIVIVAIALGILFFTFFIKDDDSESAAMPVGELEFNPIKSTKVNKIVNPAQEVEPFTLYLGDGLFYDVILPKDTEFITDGSKFVYGSNNDFSLTVLSGVKPETLSEMSGIRSAKAITQTLITSEGKRGPQECATLTVGGKAIVVRVYDNPLVYSTILSGMKENSARELPSMQILSRVPEESKVAALKPDSAYSPVISLGFSEQRYKTYVLEDGSMTIAEELKRFEDAKAELVARVTKGQSVPTLLHESEGLLYIECGEFVVGARAINLNTTATTYGYGAAAKLNAQYFLLDTK